MLCVRGLEQWRSVAEKLEWARCGWRVTYESEEMMEMAVRLYQENLDEIS